MISSCAHATYSNLSTDGNTIIEPGTIITSLGDLAEQWQWSKKKVNGFLQQLQKMEIVRVESDKDGTVISLQDLP